LITSLQIYTV